MAEKLLMLALSPTMQSGHIAKWRKKEGDKVRSGDVLCEVETDKATMEYESSADGVLLKIVMPEGQDAKIGELIAIVGKQGENISEVIQPTILEVAPIQTQSATSIQPLTLQSPIANISLENSKVKASPLAKKLAKEKGISLNQIKGSGPAGRVIKRDIDDHLHTISTPVIPTIPSTATSNKASITSKHTKISLPTISHETSVSKPIGPNGEILPISLKRKIIANRLSQSKFTAPHYYLKISVNMDPILSARQKLNADRSDKISLNSFILKICSQALLKHPIINSSWQNDQILKFSSIDISLAVAQADGLITPVVRNCQSKGILQIDSELKSLIERALSNKLAPEEFQNATFTISNLGSYGIEEFTAIINPPGSAILAIGEIRKEPVVYNDEIVIQSRMKMTLSCDHRIIDGAMGASFLKNIKNMIEEPIQALY